MLYIVPPTLSFFRLSARDALISGNRVKMGRTRENQSIYSLNSWEKGAAVSERRKAQLHGVVQYRMFSERRNALCAITQEKQQFENSYGPKKNSEY